MTTHKPRPELQRVGYELIGARGPMAITLTEERLVHDFALRLGPAGGFTGRRWQDHVSAEVALNYSKGIQAALDGKRWPGSESVLRDARLREHLRNPAVRERLAELAAFMRQGPFAATELMEVIP